MPKVSIIAPIYKSEPYLRGFIESALGQSLKDFELILVDDGSPDHCGQIIDEYAGKDSRIKVIHKENGGQSSARNAGLDIASGDYVYLPDSDDLLEPDLLETVIPKFGSGYEMIVFSFKVSPPDKKNRLGKQTLTEAQEILLNTDEERYAFLTGPFRRRAIRWEPWNRVYRRDIIEKWGLRFPKNRGIYPEDMYFNYIYLAHISKILQLPDELYTYQRHEGSVSAGYRGQLMISTSHLLAEEVCDHYGRWDDCRYLYDHFLSIYYLLHKGALRRLRRYQWKNGLSLATAREILKGEISDYPDFLQKMSEAYASPAVADSYREDRGRLLQFTDRLYTEELLGLPASGIKAAARKAFLNASAFLCRGRYLAFRAAKKLRALI